MNSKVLAGVAAVGLVVAGVYYFANKDQGSKRGRTSYRHRTSIEDSRLIEEQNAEFFRSQQEDLRKERERREKEELERATTESLRTAKLEEELRLKEVELLKEQETRRRQEEKKLYRLKLLEHLEPELPKERKGEYVTCMVRLPCGTKVTRRLSINSTVQHLHDFVETLALNIELPEKYVMVVDYIDASSKFLDNLGQSLTEAGLTRFSSFTVRIEEQYEDEI